MSDNPLRRMLGCAPIMTDLEMAEHDRALKEKAWLQGYMAGCDDTNAFTMDAGGLHSSAPTLNPYRKEK
jgi:hypothetical protein